MLSRMQKSSSPAAAVAADPAVEMACDVAEGLARRPKRVPAKYLYDGVGSRLFEAICELPWYTITRSECALLSAHAEAIMCGPGACATVVEFGCGSGAKLSMLLSAVEGRATDVHLVDISETALAQSVQALSRHPGVTLTTHQVGYEAGLGAALQGRGGAGHALVLFLGSNIGNLSSEEADRFLREIGSRCRPGDRLLLGADLVKPEAALVAAYDDPLGVTAAFNRNLLVRLNRELDADFDLDLFEHRVSWNAAASRIEVHLESLADQLVCIRGAGCCVELAEGERIWTESVYKYEPEDIVALGARAGFARRAQWIEPESRFALSLFERE